MVGKILSHYKIVSELGRGGMGIVYKAEDTKLNRTVAIKVLPVAALGNEDDRARFFREAQAAAQLHHANIATVFAIEESVSDDGEKQPFIAMEYIEGETLTEHIARGPLKLDEAVEIAAQVANALDAAHEKNIVHRDVKSGNVMLTKKGDAKVLDFGLAKTAQSTKLTQLGSTLGTIAYMSPEQARGDEVDRRSDLWSLGVLLYEMIAGRLPFASEYEQAAVYSILNEESEPLTAIRTGVPMELERIVKKLLAKDPAGRYQSVTDLLVDLRTVDLSGSGVSRADSTIQSTPVATRSPATGSVIRSIPGPFWAVVGALFVALLWTLWPNKRSDAVEISAKHLKQSVSLNGSVIGVDLSPRGDAVALAADMIRVLDLKTGQMNAYPQAGLGVHVEFSPDGQTLLLTQSTGIARISLANGSVVRILDSREGGPRATWMNDEWVIYEDRQAIFRASLTTGEILRVTTTDSLSGEYDHDWPHVLPDGKTVVATAEFRDAPSRIGFWDIESGRNLGYLNFPGYRAQWLRSGHLIFEMEQTIMALPFDPGSLSQTGPLVSIANNAQADGMSLSDDGTLVHAGMNIGLHINSQPIIPTVIVQGEMGESGDPLQIPPDRYRNLVISPDGLQAATVVETIGEIAVATDIWILDLQSGSRRLLTQGGNNDYPAWTADGDSLFFVRRQRNDDIMVIAASGRGGARIVDETPVPEIADLDISKDGSVFAWTNGSERSIDTQSTIRFSREGQVHTIESPHSNPRQIAISPDSKYVSYEDGGRILVQSLEDLVSAPVTVWERGMSLPKWAPDGSKLYAIAPDGSALGVRIQLDPVFAVLSAPKVELNWPISGVSLFDVFPDGERFMRPMMGSGEVASSVVDSTAQTIELHFIINLPAELK